MFAARLHEKRYVVDALRIDRLQMSMRALGGNSTEWCGMLERCL